MCLCVHCAFVNRCQTYHEVETIHLQPHLTETPTFTPMKPLINVNLRDYGREMEWDVVGCESFELALYHWAKLKPGLALPT